MDKHQLQARIESVEKRLRTNLESVEKKLIDLQNDIANFKAKLDEVQDEEIPEFPVFKNYENAFFCDSYELYERFHTEEYAQLFADKCREIAMLLHCKWCLEPDCLMPNWDNDKTEDAYSIYYDHNDGEYCATDCFFGHRGYEQLGIVYFSSHENALKTATWMNAHAKRGANDDEETT